MSPLVKQRHYLAGKTNERIILRALAKMHNCTMEHSTETGYSVIEGTTFDVTETSHWFHRAVMNGMMKCVKAEQIIASERGGVTVHLAFWSGYADGIATREIAGNIALESAYGVGMKAGVEWLSQMKK